MFTQQLPAIFVSSTCYDLQQLRSDLREFIESFGYEPVLSEYNSFPVDPASNTIENCLSAVEKRADIFVLVVGGRYGSQTDSGKSITNLEYIKANAKGIPVYAFVHRPVLNILPVWKTNPNADFKAVVDTPKLFEFVSSLREGGLVWTYAFDGANDIKETLRRQWAYLVRDSLTLRTRLSKRELSETLLGLSGPALRLVLERPMAWEGRLFSQVLNDEIRAAAPIKRDYEFQLAFGRSEHVKPFEIASWCEHRIGEIMKVVDGINALFGKALPEAMGLPGEPGDPEKLVYVARRTAAAYVEAIEWAQRCRGISTAKMCQDIPALLGQMSSNMIREIEAFGSKLESDISATLGTYVDGEHRTIEATLTVTVPDMTELTRALGELPQRLLNMED
jgi:hypothetical protein